MNVYRRATQNRHFIFLGDEKLARMAREICLDFTTRLIILLLFVIIFVKTLSLSKARRAKRILQKLTQELELSEEFRQKV